jgi:hypothetical protein
MSVKQMDTKKQGGAAAPTFNVFSNGKLDESNVEAIERCFGKYFSDPDNASLLRCRILLNTRSSSAGGIKIVQNQ